MVSSPACIAALAVWALAGPLPALAQKEVATQYHGWMAYFGHHRLTQRVSVYTEYQLRRHDLFRDWQQSLVRMGVDYRASDRFIWTAGYAFIRTWPYGAQPFPARFDEHRLWQQLLMPQRAGRWSMNHRYRLEQRWLEGNRKALGPEYFYRNRIRYRWLVNLPLNHRELKTDTWFLSASDEVFLQFGPNFGVNYLDQNRFYGGVGYQFSEHGHVQVGYLNQYFIKNNGTLAERNHTLQASVTYHFDWRSHESE